MLVLLVAPDHVVVDDARPLEGGFPPPTLTFDGPDYVGAGAQVHRGPTLIYSLAGRVDLDGYGHLASLVTVLVEEGVGSIAEIGALEGLRSLPVYLLAEPVIALVGDGTSEMLAGRPRLAAVPDIAELDRLGVDVVRDPGLPAGVGVVVDGIGGGARAFEVGDLAQAVADGGLVQGEVIRLAGLSADQLNGDYLVGPVSDTASGKTADLMPLRPDPAGIEALRAEASRARGDALDCRTSDPERARHLLEAAVGYEMHADRLTGVLRFAQAQQITDSIVDPGLRAVAQQKVDAGRAEADLVYTSAERRAEILRQFVELGVDHGTHGATLLNELVALGPDDSGEAGLHALDAGHEEFPPESGS